MTQLTSIEDLKAIIEKSNHIVFFGGAGVSTESGIPDFRSEQGIYNTVKNFGVPPETILSHSFFIQHTARFYEFYKSTMIYQDAKPNKAHLALAKLEQEGKLDAVITQNIDGLHQAAGSKKVYELHGTVHKNRCIRCGKFFTLDEVMAAEGVPVCDKCGGVIKPEVVLYEEGLDEACINQSVHAISNAEVLIVGGTSLNVYPAAGFVQYFRGNHLVLINKSETSYDKYADVLIHDSIGKVLSEAVGLEA